jgi:hypothetical protein
MVGARMSERIVGPDGQIWEPPLPNSSALAKPGWLTKMQMDRVNAKPIPRAVFAIERWQHRGGSAGFSCDSFPLAGRKPR